MGNDIKVFILSFNKIHSLLVKEKINKKDTLTFMKIVIHTNLNRLT
jgi:hypothetical protein